MSGTTGPVKYWLDTSVLIQAARTYYAHDFCPGFWDFLAREAQIVSIEKVEKEIARGKDRLANWISSQSKPIEFYPINDPQVIKEYRLLQQWANGSNSQYSPNARQEFAQADNADPWLIATAKAKGGVVVTHEKPNPDIRRRIPIPNVCQAFHVPYCDTWTLIRAFQARLVLAP